MKAQPSTFESTCRAISVLHSRGITGTNVLTLLRRRSVPGKLVPVVRLVHGKNASVRKELARISNQS